MLGMRRQQQDHVGAVAAQRTPETDPQRDLTGAARTAGPQSDERYSLWPEAIEQHSLGDDDRPLRFVAWRGRPQPVLDGGIPFGAAGGHPQRDSYGVRRRRRHLRQYAGVNSTSTDMSSSRPISIAKVQTQVSKPSSAA